MTGKNLLCGFALAAAFVAATLQGSRLPEPPVAGEQVAHRAGNGSDQDRYSSLAVGMPA